MTGPNERTSAVAPREWVLVAVLTILAAIVRAWSFSKAGIVQYDEGVYAFTGLGLTDPLQPLRVYPQQEKFSPPFYFSMVALSYLLHGASDYSAILVNVVLGTLTVPVLWWVGRRWFGAGAAAAAATLLVFGPTHVTLSRSGLTDVSFALNFLIALAALAWALGTKTTRAAIVAGLATGLAWNTKYHGWFAGVIAIGAVAAMHWRERQQRETRERTRVLLVAAGVAVACYVPWTLYIRSQPGSVEGWSRYFATMLDIDWFGNLMTHVKQQDYLETALSCASVPLALCAGVLAKDGPMPSSMRRLVPLVLVAGVASLIAGSFGAASLATLAAVPLFVRRGRVSDWMLLVWLALWVVMAPVYHPYFRLVLPFCVAVYLGAGAWLEEQLDRAPAEAGAPNANRWKVATGALVMAGLLVIAVPRLRPTAADAWNRSDAFRGAAATLLAHIPEGARVTVVGEPALAFYLHRAGRPAFESPTPASIDTMHSDGYLVTGVYTKRAAKLQAVLDRRRPELDSIVTVHVEPNDLRILDDAGPRWARGYRREPNDVFDVTLFRFRQRAVTP